MYEKIHANSARSLRSEDRTIADRDVKIFPQPLRCVEGERSGCPEPFGSGQKIGGTGLGREEVTGAYVYVMVSATGPLKIGVSGNPMKRLAVLYEQYPHLSSVAFQRLFKRQEAFLVERKVHDTLRTNRVSGECFDVSLGEAISVIIEAAKDLCVNEIGVAGQVTFGRTECVNVRISQETKDAVEGLAKAEGRTVSKYMERLIQAAIRANPPKKP